MSRASVPLAFPQTHAWGLDLSGTETGAGGVGGLLFAKLHASAGSPVLAPCYDGNGNVLAYLDCATGQALARYEYDPFGKLLLKEEDTRVAGRLHHQFSTKYTDDETSLSYYGYRYYAPDLGRWVSRDPIGERGGSGLYGFVTNAPLSNVDFLGMFGCPAGKKENCKIVSYAFQSEDSHIREANVAAAIKLGDSLETVCNCWNVFKLAEETAEEVAVQLVQEIAAQAEDPTTDALMAGIIAMNSIHDNLLGTEIYLYMTVSYEACEGCLWHSWKSHQNSGRSGPFRGMPKYKGLDITLLEAELCGDATFQ